MKICALVLVLALPLFAAPSVAQEPVVQTAEGILLDFQNADLRVVVAALAEAGGFNVVYGDLPSRTVTLRMSRPVPRSELLALLRSLAQANGLRIEEDGDLVRVVADPRGGAPSGMQPEQETAPDRRLFVYRLRHAQAPRLAQTLGALFGGARLPSAQAGPRPGREVRTQRIQPIELEREPDVSVEIGPVRPPSLPGEVAGDVQIVPDELTNSILIRASEEDYTVIRQAIDALDLRPLQAMIEVLIVEVRRDRDQEVGVSLGRIDSLSGRVSDRVDATLRSSAGGDFTLTVRDLGHLGIDAAVSLLSASGDVRILSRPVIVAQNNQEARIMVGAERPFVQVFRSLPTESAIRDQIVQYRDVGTTLTITPTINPDGYVNLDVLQEVSTATAETQFGAPVISSREASTRLFVRDGQSVVIGGLIDEQRDRSRSGIPLLKDIPILGYLFGTTRDRRIQSELFLFLTPHIVETDGDADRIRDAIEGRTELLPAIPDPLLPPIVPVPDTIPPDGRPR
ncbi:MAG TPA: secretin N-terminal domain-containing protein [Longimicrobiales bacterium]|nr:secretin N-terminal domain-containing protein [Longimicrobiales bacterium]